MWPSKDPRHKRYAYEKRIKKRAVTGTKFVKPNTRPQPDRERVLCGRERPRDKKPKARRQAVHLEL